MAITRRFNYVSASLQGVAPSVTITLPFPANPGDLILIFSGWFAQLANQTPTVTGGVTQLQLNNNYDTFHTGLAVWYKVALGGESSFTVSHADSNAGSTIHAAAGVWTGVETSDLSFGIDASGIQANASSTSVTAPTISPKVYGDTLLFFGSDGNTNQTWTAPTNMATDQLINASFVGNQIYIATQRFDSSRPTGALVATMNAADVNGGVAILLRPALSSVFNPKVLPAGGAITTINVPAASLTLTGQAPSESITIAVPAAALTLTTQAPTVSQVITIAVPAGALTLTAQAPIEKLQVAVPAAALTLTTQAPTVSQIQTISVPAAALTLTSQSPVVSQAQNIAVPAGALTLTTQAPVVSQIITIAVPAGALTLTGQAPSEKLQVAVPAAALTLTTQAPTVTVSTNTVIAVPAGSLSLTTQAPTESLTVAVPSASLSLAAQAPTVTVSANTTISVPAGSLTLTSQAPTVTPAPGDITINVPTAGLGLSAFPPTIPGGAVAGDPSEHHYGHGHGGRRHKRLEILYIGNEVYAIPMEDVPELKERLAKAKKLYRDNKKRYTPVTVFGVPPEGEDFTVKVAISFDFGVWLAQFRANATDIELEQRLRADSLVKIEQETRLRRRKLIMTLLSGPDV